MIVCHCRERSAADITAAAELCGSHDAEVVADFACAGDDCGSCIAAIERILASATLRLATTAA